MRALAAALVLLFVASGCAGSAGVSLESARGEQIALARSSNPLFSIFPARPGVRACTIPEGGPAGLGPLRGTCATSISAAQTHEPELFVTFTETWPACPRGGDCVIRQQRAIWLVRETEPIVTPGAHLHVWPAEETGVAPPQNYR